MEDNLLQAQLLETELTVYTKIENGYYHLAVGDGISVRKAPPISPAEQLAWIIGSNIKSRISTLEVPYKVVVDPTLEPEIEAALAILKKHKKRLAPFTVVVAKFPTQDLSPTVCIGQLSRKHLSELRQLAELNDWNVCYTDGSAFPKEQAAGLAWYMNDSWYAKGYLGTVSVNDLEMRAVVKAVESYSSTKPLVVVTDSQHVILRLKKPKTAQDRHFAKLIKTKNVKIVWAKGHNDPGGHNKADSLSRAVALKSRKERRRLIFTENNLVS